MTNPEILSAKMASPRHLGEKHVWFREKERLLLVGAPCGGYWLALLVTSPSDPSKSAWMANAAESTRKANEFSRDVQSA